MQAQELSLRYSPGDDKLWVGKCFNLAGLGVLKNWMAAVELDFKKFDGRLGEIYLPCQPCLLPTLHVFCPCSSRARNPRNTLPSEINPAPNQMLKKPRRQRRPPRTGGAPGRHHGLVNTTSELGSSGTKVRVPSLSPREYIALTVRGRLSDQEMRLHSSSRHGDNYGIIEIIVAFVVITIIITLIAVGGQGL